MELTIEEIQRIEVRAKAEDIRLKLATELTIQWFGSAIDPNGVLPVENLVKRIVEIADELVKQLYGIDKEEI